MWTRFCLQSMYALMAKCEELNTSMAPVYKLRDQMYPCVCTVAVAFSANFSDDPIGQNLSEYMIKLVSGRWSFNCTVYNLNIEFLMHTVQNLMVVIFVTACTVVT